MAEYGGQTRTRLIISSCVINLDLSTIGREARWSRHPADRSICLHWWICSHTYMRTSARAPAYAHPHPPTPTPTCTKRAGWVSLCSAKRPNPPPGWRRSLFSTTADASSYSPSLKVRRSLQSESSGLHQCHAFLLNGSARLPACCPSLCCLSLSDVGSLLLLDERSRLAAWSAILNLEGLFVWMQRVGSGIPRPCAHCMAAATTRIL